MRADELVEARERAREDTPRRRGMHPAPAVARAAARPDSPQVANVPVDRLRAHPDNVRRDLGDLRELTASIRGRGVLQPLRVERRGDFMRIRAGHRRAAAAQLAKLRKVPCVIVSECETDEAIVEMFGENLHREGLSVEEKRDNAQRLIREFDYTVEGVAAAIGVAQTTVAAWLRVGDAPTPVARADGRKQIPGSRKAWVPRVKPTRLHDLIGSWRGRAADGLNPDQAQALLADLEDLLQGWVPQDDATTVNEHVLAQVAELDPENRMPVQELADRIGCHTKLVQRARAGLKRAAS